ncbi:MAG: hypothetical protein JNL74_17125, partial [Fibrobacteres bacterium]|nr:hypothetical protein [Fibrobacterota bacterium]
MMKKIFLVLLVLSVNNISGFTFVKHILNDSLQRDTLFHRGSSAGQTQAVVNLIAKSSSTRCGSNILIVADFSESMKSNAQDTAVPKIFLMRDAVRKFIDNHLQPDDGLALMRFNYGYATYPEREKPWKKNTINFKVRVEAGGRVVLRDTFYVSNNCRAFQSTVHSGYDSYGNCVPRHTFGSVLGGLDKFGQPWGRNPFGIPIDSIRINGVGYVLDTVINDSVMYVEGNPPLTASVNAVALKEGTNFGQRFPRDEVYSDTFYFVPGTFKGVASQVYVGNFMGANYTLDYSNSYGIERIWYEFSKSYPGFLGTPNPVTDSGATHNILDPSKPDFSWVDFSNNYVDRRLSGGNTATYYNIWQAVRYALAHNDKASAPIIIFLSDGTDEGSPGAFRNANSQINAMTTNPYQLPRHFSSIPNDTSYSYVRTQFESFMRDSIGTSVSLYTIMLDTFPGRPDYQTLWRSSNLSSTVDSKHFHMLGGSDLDSVYNLIGKEIRVSVARPISNQPMFVDMLNKVDGARYVAGTLQAGPTNSITLDSIRIDSLGDNYIFRFYSPALNADATLDYFYRIEADITAPSLAPKHIILNPDPLLSRIQFYNTSNELTTIPFNKDTLYVKSTVERLLLSRNQTTLDTSGIGNGSRILSYSIIKEAIDTSLNIYSLLRLRGTNNSETLVPVNSSWTFNPLAWLDNGSRSISLSSSNSASPYVKISYEPNGVNDKAYDLRSRYLNPQTGAWMDAQLSFMANSDTVDFYDSIVIAVGSSSTSNITNSYTISGTVEELNTRSPVTMFALGRSRNTGQYNTLSGNWNVVSGLTKYPGIIGNVNGISASSIAFSISPDMSSQQSQSDSGYIRVSYVNALGQAKSYVVFVRILDNTDRTAANSVAIFLASDYLPNQNNSAALENLFVNTYDVPNRSFTKMARDTVLEVYALLFSKRAGFSPKYKGLDIVKSWTVRPGISVTPPIGDLSNLRYTNHFAPRVDTIEVTSSIDSTRRIIIRWSYGTGRVLSLESRAGLLNDNVAGRIVGKDVSLLDQHISSDTIFASLRDEFGNFISYNDTIEWRIINSGYGSYINFTQSNPSIISKLQNGQQEYTMTATIPSGSSVIGTGGTISIAIRDTLRVNLSASGFDAMRVVVSGGQSFTSEGTTYPEYVSPPTSSIISIRAGDAQSDSLFPSFTAYIHKIGQAGQLPLGWEQASQGIKWYYKNNAPFAGSVDTVLYNVSSRRIKPTHHIVGLIDTMIAEWVYNSVHYRDSIRFRTLPPYPVDYTITMPSTITAGDSALLTISFVDHNGQPVTDPSVLPSSVSLLSNSTDVQFRGNGNWISGLDSVFTHVEGISFLSGVSRCYVLSTKADSVTFTMQFARRPGDTVTVIKTIRILPAAAHALKIKYRTPLVDCAADTMDVTAISGRFVPYRVYTALLLDSYGNLLSNSANAFFWSATGTIDTGVGVFTSMLNQLEYNARGIKSLLFGNIICRYSSTIADSFPLSIFASINVTALSTHEWIADVTNKDTIDADKLTINNVISTLVPTVAPSSLSDARKLALLDSLGYKPYQDGYLDYINISFSSPVRLSKNCIDSIFIDGVDSLRKYWKVKKFEYGYSSANPKYDSVSFHSIVPNDGTYDPALANVHSRYRIWLKPTPLLKAAFSPGPARVAWSLAMET